MQKRKLRIVIGTLEVGGAERHLSFILPKLKSRGWDIRIFTFTEERKGDLADFFRANDIKLNTLQTSHRFDNYPRIIKRGLKICANLSRLFKEFRQDKEAITHFFLPEAYILGAIVAKASLHKAPLLMSRRSLNYYQAKRPFTRFVEMQLHKRVDVILGNSKGVLKQLIIDEKVPPKNLGLIYNGIAIEKHPSLDKNKCRQELEISKEAYVITIVANLIHYKGHEDLIHALGRIKDKLNANWLLLVVGDDRGIGKKLKNIAQDMAIADNIRWLGSRDDVKHILYSSDLGVLCSHEEGFSNAILETMACGLPMVVTDVGGNKEAVVNNECGLVVSHKSPEELANAIYWMYMNQQEAKKMGETARKRMLDLFSLDTCVDMYNDLYDKLLQGDVRKANAIVATQDLDWV